MSTGNREIRPLLTLMAVLAISGLVVAGGYTWLLFGTPHRVVWWLALVLGVSVMWVVPLGLVGLGCLALVAYGRPPGPALGLARAALRFLFPLARSLSSWWGWDQDKVWASFVHLHNRLILAGLPGRRRGVSPADVLVLLPHCLQKTECRHKITWDTGNCQRCGACPVGDALDLSEQGGFRIAVASGGTQARRLVEETSPSTIVAVACERELGEGIRDVSSIPVLAVFNQRPEGPCRNTRVNPADLKATLSTLEAKGEV